MDVSGRMPTRSRLPGSGSVLGGHARDDARAGHVEMDVGPLPAGSTRTTSPSTPLAEPEVLGADPDLAVVREREPLGRLRREEVHRGTADEGGTKRSTGRR